MAKKLVNEITDELQEEKISALKEFIDSTFFKDDKHNDRNAAIKQMQTIKLTYEQVAKMSSENILFYLNYNKGFGLSRFKTYSYEKRLEILDKLLTVDLQNRANVVHFADFLIWSMNYLYKDEDMTKLVQYFCDNTNYKHSYQIFEVYSVYVRLVDDMKCKEVIVAKHKEVEAIKEEKIKSRIIL